MHAIAKERIAYLGINLYFDYDKTLIFEDVLKRQFSKGTFNIIPGIFKHFKRDDKVLHDPVVLKGIDYSTHPSSLLMVKGYL